MDVKTGESQSQPSQSTESKKMDEAAALEAELDAKIAGMSTADLQATSRLLENEIRIMRSEFTRVKHLLTDQTDKIKENKEKIKVNKVLPYLVSNVIEVNTTNWHYMLLAGYYYHHQL